MADVYRGMDIRLERAVAVKVFRLGTDEVGRARFEEEARLLAGLNHPGLVSLFDASANDAEAYLVMGLVEGETLAASLRRGPLPPYRVIELGRDLAEVLDYVHGNGIVHRDVKPSNVLVAPNGEVFLADFGISRLADAVGRLTRTSDVIGTAAYMAPEQVRGRIAEYAADVYSLALVLLECVTGRVEYPGTGAEAAIARLSRPPNVPSDLPEPLAGALLAMTATDPEARPTAGQCADWLASAVSPVGGYRTSLLPTAPPGTAEFPVPDTGGKKRRRWWPWVAAAGAVVVGATAAAVTLLPQVQPAHPAPNLPPVAGAPGAGRLPADLTNLERMVSG
jgi:serine/threonine protein kinase